MAPAKDNLLAMIPAVEALLQDEAVKPWAKGLPRRIVVHSIREAVEETRQWLLSGDAGKATVASVRETILARARVKARCAMGPHYCKAINATGIILHTNLGRAVLARRALRQIEEALAGYSVLEIGIETGKRGQRDTRIEWLLQQLTGCEAATVVNNNAAATMIVLNTVACGKEVIVSRGQLVEIGGSYRLPEVLAASGAKLVEVGTTNRTYASDYEAAITDNTAAILRVHPSNFKVMGFAAEASLDELVAIARAHHLPLIDDVGAGALTDFAPFGFRDQPTLQESVRAGADLVTSSADKLMGACQGGIILGTATWIEAIRRNPLARVVRVGKLTLAALEATLTLFLDEELALRELPTLRMLAREASDVAEQAKRIAQALQKKVGGSEVTVIEGESQMGAGSLPTENIPTSLVAITPSRFDASELAACLRHYSPPIFARIQEERVLIDPRTLQDGEDEVIVKALVEILGAQKS